MDDLEQLKGLDQDLLAVGEAHLSNFERLFAELEARLPRYKNVLEKPPRSNASRQQLTSGKIVLDEDEFNLNVEFQQSAIQLADILNLDELRCAQLLIQVQGEQQAKDRNILETAIIQYHEARKLHLDSLESIFRFSSSSELTPEVKEVFGELANAVIEHDGSLHNGGTAYRRKCLSCMADVQAWVQDISEKIQTAAISGGSSLEGFNDIMDFQQKSLVSQHCSLGLILSHLARRQHAIPQELSDLTNQLALMGSYDSLLIHYVPYLSTLILSFGSPERGASLKEAREVHKILVDGREKKLWAMRSFQAAAMAWWLCEYSEWFNDDQLEEEDQNQDSNTEAEARSKLFHNTLKEGAFDFTMSLSADIKPRDWHDPIRHGLRQALQAKAPFLATDSPAFPEIFQIAVLESIESFVDAFVSNMPDTIRQLRNDEEEQRRLTRGTNYGHDIEKFLVLISYSFERRPDAALAFWSDNDSNMYGFLQWTAKRPTTPRASALCEVIIAISGGSDNADSAHNFLLQEGSGALGKLRRTHSVTWSQILSELQFHAERIADQAATLTQSSSFSAGQSHEEKDQESEKNLLHESYLRLVAHLCRESGTVRDWLLTLPGLNIIELCLSLAGKHAPHRIRACSFELLASILTNKTRILSETIWTSLEQWTSGSVSSAAPTSKPSNAPSWTGEQLLESISWSFEEPNSFVRLLQALLGPASDASGINDSLPFPEHLGSSTRMPGVDLYLDFALGTVFGNRIDKLSDTVQNRTLRLSCLDLILTCLSSFNEDLVIFANKANVSVDDSIQASSLTAYVQLHPFSRVMEWMFNDRVVKALFDSLHQETRIVADAAVDSPLFLSVLRSIQVTSAILEFQPTYLTIVRPAVKLKVTKRAKSVANSSLATFEDTILNHLGMIVDLCHFCGTGHHELTTAALSLLERLSSSEKLVNSSIGSFGNNHGRNKLVGVLEMSGEADQVSEGLTEDLQIDPREFELGSDTPAYLIKSSILSFLDGCLKASSNTPSIAHLMLGFSCRTNHVDIASNGKFARGASLFHAVQNIALQWPQEDEDGFRLWLVQLRTSSIKILQTLWTAAISSTYVFSELRSSSYLATQFLSQNLISANTYWEQRSILDPVFFASPSASCLADYCRQRTALFEYAASEFRLAIDHKIPSLKDRTLATLFGSSPGEGGEQIPHLTIFDLFDFADLQLNVDIDTPDLLFFSGLDFGVCSKTDTSGVDLFDISSIQELLELRRIEQAKQGRLGTLAEEESIAVEAQQLVLLFHGQNQQKLLRLERLETLTAWTQLIIVIADGAGLDLNTKQAFVLQVIQVILPKLEQFCQGNIQEAWVLACAVHSLLIGTDFPGLKIVTDQIEGNESDQLFYLFNVVIRAIHVLDSTSALRLVLYQICLRYLSFFSSDEPGHGQDQILRAVKANGERLLEVMCDDAIGSDEACRVSALMTLEALVALTNIEESATLVRALERTNFTAVTVDSLKFIPTDLRESDASGIPVLLSYFQAKFALLLRLSSSRAGATSVVNAGFFQAIRESTLFSVDPDIGVEIDNPDSLKRFYELMLSALRIVNAIVLSRGSQSSQTMNLVRRFLTENRASMLAVLKRHARIGGVHLDKVGDLEELVENYVLLIQATNFLEFEDQALPRKAIGEFL